MARYEPIDLAELLEQRLDPEALNGAELEELARTVFGIAETLAAELDLELRDASEYLDRFEDE